ncbi:lysine exporter LysO family protein [Pseudomonas yamanorum]|uniref:lysine exporter LysO family protein n=1 Tax=Pseudomonas yamanorum TaxID=515393 RepID=UPI003BA3C80E
MTVQALSSILPILIALGIGLLSSKLLFSDKAVARLVSLISPLVWGLLFLIGTEFGEVVSSLDAVGYVLKISSLVAVATTVVPCMLLLGLVALRGAGREPGRAASFDMHGAAAPLKECCITLLMVALGVLFTYAESTVGSLWLPPSNVMLMVLIFLVGLDLSSIKLGRDWISWGVLSVPIAVVIGSILGAYAVHFITGEDIRLLLALSTGFGWFTLSSVLVGGLSGEIHGATALLADLGRELIAIALLYLVGGFHPKVGIAAAGATALDSTLPIVRQTCHCDTLPTALMSGLILTVLAPFFITFFLTA